MIEAWNVLIPAFFVSFFFTAIYRNYAISRDVLDLPNERSSHSIPTPRGGGISFVVVFLGGLPFVLSPDQGVFLTALMASVPVALIGFIDDQVHVSARWRLWAHFAAASWVLYWLGGFPPLGFFGKSFDLGWFGNLLAVFYLVWLLNLYNFMDGIDGIAGIEAITVCFGGALVYALAEPMGTGWVVPVMLLAAVAGFLFWNFPRARIFMGDAGSGFLGLMMGVFSIHAAAAAPEIFWCWVILLGVFVVDATLTLFRRIWRGEKFYEAHRSHAYQYAARKYGAHWRVSLAVAVINLFWLLPFALLVAVGWVDGVVGVLLSYLPLTWLAFRYNAGAAESVNVLP
ncbi:MAG: glycosyltransferase family 4 protein [Desulfobulbaceae bacterium]|nr:glycosyltransferase family 4 protein [Desulfobulbaceae bacterium]